MGPSAKRHALSEICSTALNHRLSRRTLRSPTTQLAYKPEPGKSNNKMLIAMLFLLVAVAEARRGVGGGRKLSFVVNDALFTTPGDTTWQGAS